MFFEHGTQSSTRHRRIKHFLLFTLRFLLLLLVILAFTDPFLRRSASAKDGLLLVVVDKSFSMQAGSRFTDAKREALETLRNKPRSQPAQVIALGEHSEVLTPPTSDAAQLIAALNTIQVEDSYASYADLSRSVHALSDSSFAAIELHLFSDMQRTAMPDNFAEAVLPDKVMLIIHSVSGDPPSPNWTVESTDAPIEVADTANQSVSHVKAVIRGFATAGREKTVALLVNGKTAVTRTITIPPGGSSPVEFAPFRVSYGFNHCEIRIEGKDSLPSDDVARFVIRRIDAQRILFVHSSTDQRSPLYFETALNAATGGSYVLQSAAADQTANIDPTKFAFVVLSDSTSLPSTFEHALEQFVSNGGGVLITLGLDAERRKYIPLWSGSLQQAHDYSAQGGEDIGQIDFTFPAVEQSKPSRENGGWAGTKVSYVASVDPSGARVVAKLSDGTPLLLAKQIRDGHLLLFSSGFDNLTNNLPLQPIFVHFIDKTSEYLSGTGQLSGSRTVGSFVQLRSPGANRREVSSVEVVDPQGRRPLSLTDGRTANTFRLAQAGFYKIHLANGREAQFGVNTDRRESDLTPMSPEMLSLWTRSNDSPPGPRRGGTPPARYRNLDLWWYIILLAFVVAVAEILLSNAYLSTQREEI
jgi:hypothetical protein